MEKLIFIGSDGIPARYGGWETFVEQIAPELVENFSVTVLGSSKGRLEKIQKYRGVNITYIPLNANGISSIFFDFLALCYCVKNKQDHIVMLGVSTALFVPFIRRFLGKIYINVDGIEWRRQKWSALAKGLLKLCENISVKYADVIIADNLGIQHHIENTYLTKKAVMIPYGGNHAVQVSYCKFIDDLSINLIRKSYLSICRIEPENNVHLILKALSGSKEDIVFVGNWCNSAYGKKLYQEYKDISNLHLLDPIYDPAELYTLRQNCKAYIHGHSAGGTNPSLVEIMFHKKLVYAFDCEYNRSTLNNYGKFFKDTSSLISILMQVAEHDIIVKQALDYASEHYRWDIIGNKYKNLLLEHMTCPPRLPHS